MKQRILRWSAGLALAAAILGAFAGAPRLLRRMDVFQVRQVEVLGTRYLEPTEVLETSGITREATVFDPFEPWLEALGAHPLVAAVRIERDLPSTLVVHVEEVEPVALARTPALRPVDGEGRLLPIDPTRSDLDLPVLAVPSAIGADGRLADRRAVALAQAIRQIQRLDPAFVRRVSEVAIGEGGLRLVLREPVAAEALLPSQPGAERLEQLRLTLADLSAREELPRLRRIDARFRDQVVVSLKSTPRS